MKKIIRSKIFYLLLIASIVVSVVLVVFNYAQLQKYQTSKRNDERKAEIKSLVEGLTNYMNETSNVPTTSNPVENSFLPELLLLDGKKPSGGVNIQTLENVSNYFNINQRDPSGTPYLIGTLEDTVVVYTNNFEQENQNTDIYFESIPVPAGQKTEAL